MSVFEAIVLGIVQGLTEFLPISSSGHLRIVPALVGWDDPGTAFTAVIQLGTMAAVVIFFWSDLWRITRAWFAELPRALRWLRASGDERASLAPGADADRVAGFLLGLLQAAPDLLLHTPELVAALNAALAAMEAEAFLAVLPDLRRAFTWLKPSETSRLARQLAELTGARASDLDAVLSIDPAVAEQAAALERELTGSLVRDGLAAWLAS